MPWWTRRVEKKRPATSAEPVKTPWASQEPIHRSQGETLYTRNWAYISAELQDHLATTTLFTAGAGLGSVVATLAARTGVKRFIIADGDTVEESNLNRQSFSRMHLGQNKAEATAALIKDIQPEAHIEVVDHYLDSADCARLIPRADIILNTIDLDTLAFLDLNRVARAAQKPVLFPLNPYWMGTLIVFTPTSQSLDDLLGIEHEAPSRVSLSHVTTRLMEHIYAHVPGGMPPSMRSLMSGYLKGNAPDLSDAPSLSSTGEGQGAPQLGATAYLTAALTVRALVALVAHEPVRVAPQVITVDAIAMVGPLT
jgi:molybdopterin/thiamine biosynthesis adenylyltransferase